MSRKTNIPSAPSISPRAFWDTDMRTLDFGRHAAFIITRVFERGTPKDKEVITRYYGPKRITRTLTEAPSLLPAAREWAKHMFHLSDQDFSCCTGKQPARHFSRY